MKYRLWILILLGLCFVTLPLLAHAEYSGTCGANLTWKLDDNQLLTISGTGKMNDYYGTGTSAPWLKYGIKKVKVNSGVTSIGSGAFWNVETLTSVTLPSSLTSIGSCAFMNCKNLPGISLPSNLKTIGQTVFAYCESLKSIQIPNSVTSIGGSAFSESGLTSITIPSSVKTLGNSAFLDCTSLKNVTIENGLSVIESWTFGRCTSLERVTIPKSVTDIGPSALEGCGSQMTVCCYSGSYAYSYAKEKGFRTVLMDVKPNISKHPSSLTIAEGKTASFSVTATNAARYQWYYLMPGADTWNKVGTNGTSSTYSLKTEARHNGYKYRCKAENDAGSVFSNTATLTVISKPVITTQPTNKKVNEGEKATFKVVATGATNWQWYYQKPGKTTWNEVSTNGTSATYSLTTEARHNGYKYRCKASNSAGSVWSNTVMLTVVPKPVITTQPTNKKVNEGEKATFKVVATGATSWQWYYKKPDSTDWNKVSTNGTSATYTLTTEARHNGYKYRCKVSNNAGSVWSNTVTLTVIFKPVITTQPTNKKVNEGEKATFKVAATGGGLSWQWYYQKPGKTTWNEVNTNGASATYTVTTEARHNGYKYRCKVSNSKGSVWSNTVMLTVVSKPVITTQPTNKKVNEGKNATFKVVATGATSWQWYYKKPDSTDWNKVSTNSTSANYTVTTAARHNGYKYRCKVSNNAGSVWSNTVTLTVIFKPVITTQPTNKKVNEGEKATFKVAAKGGDLSWQWYYKKPDSTDWNKVSNNGTSATYTLTTAARHNGYKYKCKVTNAVGSVFSAVVTLTVQ